MSKYIPQKTAKKQAPHRLAKRAVDAFYGKKEPDTHAVSALVDEVAALDPKEYGRLLADARQLAFGGRAGSVSTEDADIKLAGVRMLARVYRWSPGVVKRFLIRKLRAAASGARGKEVQA